MNVSSLAEAAGLREICVCDGGREVTGGYTGDLLSWVMSRAVSGNVWITIMNNINVIAVASLCDVSCVVFAEGVTADGEVTSAARAKGVNLLYADRPAYELCAEISALLKGGPQE